METTTPTSMQNTVTRASIEAKIAGYQYLVVNGKMTICVVTMRNGFSVIGEAAPVDPANYNKELGEQYALDDCIRKLWELEGYLLAEDMHVDDLLGADFNRLKLEGAAKAAHDINRAYCQAIGDFSQASWADAPQWQKDSAIKGVEFLIEHPDATPADMHQSWMDVKYADGWVWGEEKDPDFKTHPLLVAYDQLPEAQRTKDILFQATVRSYMDMDL